MTKYSKSEIMKKAWNSYRNSHMNPCGKNTTFAECLKIEWAIAKRDVIIEAETIRYFNEVCVNVIENGEDAVYEAFNAWYREAHKDSMDMIGKSKDENEKFSNSYKARMRAWKAAKAVFRKNMPTFSTELVDSQMLKEIAAIENV